MAEGFLSFVDESNPTDKPKVEKIRGKYQNVKGTKIDGGAEGFISFVGGPEPEKPVIEKIVKKAPPSTSSGSNSSGSMSGKRDNTHGFLNYVDEGARESAPDVEKIKNRKKEESAKGFLDFVDEGEKESAPKVEKIKKKNNNNSSQRFLRLC